MNAFPGGFNGRAAPLALYLEGLITMWIGWRSPWVDVGEPGHELALTSWRNQQVVSNIGAGAAMLEALLALGFLVAGAYGLVQAWRRRSSPPASEVSPAALTSAVIAAIGLACTAIMIVRTYGFAGAWAPPGILERPEGPVAIATVTSAPWLLLGGHLSILVAGVWTSRLALRARRRPVTASR